MDVSIGFVCLCVGGSLLVYMVLVLLTSYEREGGGCGLKPPPPLKGEAKNNKRLDELEDQIKTVIERLDELEDQIKTVIERLDEISEDRLNG